MIDVVWVTNIPTPYRNFLHACMARHFPRFGLRFRVHYTAWTEPDRHWHFEASDFQYPYQVHAGLHPRIRGVDLHINPGLLAELLRTPHDLLVVGGWSSPSAALAPFLSCARRRVLYTESHASSTRWTHGPAHWVKRRVAARYDAFIVPGTPQRRFVEQLAPEAQQRPFIRLPNLIDRSLFEQGVDKLRAERGAIRRAEGLDPRKSVWLCPARLEEFKGLSLFLPRLEGQRGLTLLVAGEGSQRRELEELVRARSLPVRLLGQQAVSALQRLYAAADLFVLPSLRDPSPLSPIEACAAGLPLLVSERIGNREDVLPDAGNGWSFEPENAMSATRAIEAAAAASPNVLAAMGARSRSVYRERFDPDRCVEQLAHGLVALYRA